MIPISEKENSYEKEVEEKLRREITEEFETKKVSSRKKKALILSGIGGIMYLIEGILFFGISWGLGAFSTSYLTVGIISLVGTGIGAKRIKIGGTVILISIPISIVIGLISLNWSISSIYIMILTMLSGGLIPYISVGCVLIGGILCFQSSDE